jgi:starvation-inducible DNA-binding protein
MVEQALMNVFCSNFVAYYKSHAAHFNVTGRHFVSDHELLNKIYEDLQGEIDTLGELLRTIKAEAPLGVKDIVDGSSIDDDLYADSNEGLDYLEQIYDDIEQLIEIHLDLEDATSDSREYNHLANYAQDRVRDLQKFCWMLRATIDGRDPY